MKHDAFAHPKFRLAARDLGISLAMFRGLMVSLWHVADTHFPAGDVGRFSNEEIVAAMEHDGDPDLFVAVLVRRRLLDEIDGPGRLYIHDWHEHCQDFTRQKLRNRKTDFANGAAPYGSTEHLSTSQLGTKKPSTENHREEQKTTEKNRAEQKSTVFHSRVVPEPEPEPEPVPVPRRARAREGTAAAAATGELPQDLNGSTDWHHLALKLYREHEKPIWEFFRTPPAQSQAEEVLGAIAFHLAAGRTIGPEEVAAAVKGAQQWCRKERRGRPSAGALVISLAEVVNPDREQAEEPANGQQELTPAERSYYEKLKGARA